MTLWIETLQRLVPVVDEKMAAAKAEQGEFSHADYDGWRKRTCRRRGKADRVLHQRGRRPLELFARQAPIGEDGRPSRKRPPAATSGRAAELATLQHREAGRQRLTTASTPHGSGPVPIEAEEG
jgi:hypothetical protein